MNLPTKRALAIAVTLVLAGLALAQTPARTHSSAANVSTATSITGITGPNGGFIATSGTATFTAANSVGGGTCWFTDNGAAATCGANTAYESRKLDGNGPTLKQVDYSAKPLRSIDLPPASYVRVAKEAGVDSAVIEEAQMLDAIKGLNLHVYNWDKVDQYLYRKALSQGTNMRWVWKPVRSADLKQMSSIGWGFKEGAGFIYQKLYAQRLPLRILERIKEIQDCEPDALFLVSDYEVVRPDPFLAISTKQLLEAGKLWIVDRWDEPTFDDGTELEVRASR